VPEQQSVSTLHDPPERRQGGGAHAPRVHVPEQQSALTVHVAAVALHAGRHEPAEHI